MFLHLTLSALPPQKYFKVNPRPHTDCFLHKCSFRILEDCPTVPYQSSKSRRYQYFVLKPHLPHYLTVSGSFGLENNSHYG